MSFLNQPLTQIFIKPLRKIGDIEINVILHESSNDTLTITKQPVQRGASISDHAYKEPTTLQMTAYFNDNGFLGITLSFDQSSRLGSIYQNLLDLQASRIPFDIVTPKRIYRSMLFSVLGLTTDKNTENILAVQMSFQEVIIVSVGTVQVPRRAQKNPGATGKTENAGKKSALLTLKQGIGTLLGK